MVAHVWQPFSSHSTYCLSPSLSPPPLLFTPCSFNIPPPPLSLIHKIVCLNPFPYSVCPMLIIRPLNFCLIFLPTPPPHILCVIIYTLIPPPTSFIFFSYTFLQSLFYYTLFAPFSTGLLSSLYALSSPQPHLSALKDGTKKDRG